MQSWIMLWKVVLVVGLILFSIMSVWVAIGGFFDVKTLLTSLKDQHQEVDDEDE